MKAILEIIKFDAVDVITTSPVVDDEDTGTGQVCHPVLGG